MLKRKKNKRNESVVEEQVLPIEETVVPTETEEVVETVAPVETEESVVMVTPVETEETVEAPATEEAPAESTEEKQD